MRPSALSAQFPLVLTALESCMRWDRDASLAACRAPVSAIVSAVTGVSHYLLLEDPRAAADALAAVLAQ